MFIDRLAGAVQARGNGVLVGLDPRWENLPLVLRERFANQPADAYRAFCLEIIDVVAPLVPAVKPQMAFFEQLGPPGMQALFDVIAAARQRGLLVILDGKRNDIGSTATAYAEAYLGPPEISAWGADALTVSPYLGSDSLQPFVELCRQRDSGIFVLVKTSNPGSSTLQDRLSDGEPLYQHLGRLVNQLAEATLGQCGYGAVGAVVGATYPQHLQQLRALMPHTWFLVPGFGAQGGSAADVAPAFDARGLGAIVNNSRGIIFAHERPEFAHLAANQWQEAVAAATRAMIDQLGAVVPSRTN